jgi:hypothetical protein
MADTIDKTVIELPDGEYAIAEIMGHSTMIGRFTEVERFGTKMLQLEPIWQGKLLPAVFIGGASLYRFTPCTKDIAIKRQPTERYQLPEALRATLPPEPMPALQPPQGFNGEGYPHEEEEEEEDERDGEVLF